MAAKPLETANSLKAQIHIGKAQLGMDDGDYRALLKRVTGKDSAGKMGMRELIAVRDEMKRLGFKVVSKKHKAPAVGGDKAALVGKVGALLADADRPWEYLTKKTESLKVKEATRPMSLLERITGKADDGTRGVGKERIEFCDAADLRKIVAMLEYDRRRRAKKAGGSDEAQS